MSPLRNCIVLCLCCLCSLAWAQDKKAQHFFEKGEEAFRQRAFTEAESQFAKALERFPEYTEVYDRLGQIALSQRHLALAQNRFEKLLQIDPQPQKYPHAIRFLATQYLKAAEYDKAIEYLETAKAVSKGQTRILAQLDRQMQEALFAKKAYANPMEVNPKRLPKEINIRQRQYFPAFTADDETIYFTALDNGGDEDIYESHFVDGRWQEAQKLNGGINTEFNEGTCSISADGKMLVFTNCEGRESFGGCDLFVSYFEGKTGWSPPENLGPEINSSFWESQPTLSSDGKQLIFVSDRYGGFGGKDLYISKKDAQGRWMKAQNLGKSVNTMAEENTPFLHPNGRTLFFSSNGHLGLGGFDLFMSEEREGVFGEPENLGFPINDKQDQFSLVVSANGQKGYYSVQEGDRVDLFDFVLPEEIKKQINPTFYLKGMVHNALGDPLKARLQLIDLKSGERIARFQSDLKGEYLVVLPEKGDYGLYVEAEGYFFKSLSFALESKSRKSQKELNIALEKIEKQKTSILNNIYFDEGSFVLKKESKVELDKLFDLIQENPNLEIEIAGHTDDVGNDADNLVLSEKRANAVVHYLIEKGIEGARLHARGYGESDPLYPNDNAENRSLNRRIEMKFI
ncbi:OmpA family protein [Marinilongibacter aquaticus]|uniref:OmpA family protein n=1 Tax=Marinilongibacter aquaticus TaxID=2975157 RepID=UPI0021BDE724|nr:OmpA family protein [Marinilongibacter aquaticus]UBM58899.1 OmpA family protein [Marinilongibacter aquaticus]